MSSQDKTAKKTLDDAQIRTSRPRRSGGGGHNDVDSDAHAATDVDAAPTAATDRDAPAPSRDADA